MDGELTLVGHLSELKKRIVISLVALGAGTALSLPFASALLKIFRLPASGVIEKLAFFSPQEAFLIYMRMAFFSGLVVSMPVILYQTWAFILPAMEEKMKKYGTYFILFCAVSFIGGCLFAYFLVIPSALKFLLGFGKGDLEPVISTSKYISFVVSLSLGCGLVFQMPVLSLILTRVGVITSLILRKKYKYAVVIIFVIAAIITPTPDVFNMLILALPMLFLYELSIWVSFFSQPKRR